MPAGLPCPSSPAISAGPIELAEQCACATGATAVITTATDAHGLPSFDMLAKEQGWVIDDLSRVKILNTLLLEGEEIAVVDPTGQVERFVTGRGNLRYFPDFQAALRSKAAGLPVRQQPRDSAGTLHHRTSWSSGPETWCSASAATAAQRRMRSSGSS